MTGTGPAVVVGVDGSDGSRAALRYALDEAGRRRAGLRVVVAYAPSDYWADLVALDRRPPTPDPGTGATARARAMVQEVVAERRARAATLPADEVEVVGAAGPPADVLIDAADGAELLVVGHRGRGAAHGRLTGPVALGCVLRSRCPVTVVPPTSAG